MTTINASDFKARCLAILDRVHETGERVVILKRGKPVAEISRVVSEGNRYPQAELEGRSSLPAMLWNRCSMKSTGTA